jgi:hypothetical protein
MSKEVPNHIFEYNDEIHDILEKSLLKQNHPGENYYFKG